jgi:hypothetical protein
LESLDKNEKVPELFNPLPDAPESYEGMDVGEKAHAHEDCFSGESCFSGFQGENGSVIKEVSGL